MKKLFLFAATALLSISMYAANISVADAIAAGKDLKDDGTEESAQTYTVEGYVVKLYNTYYNSTQSFYMHDEKGFDGYCEFEAFKAKLGKAVAVGAKVTITGKLVNYKGTIEIKDCPGEILEEAVPEEMTFAEALEALNAIKKPADGKTNYGGYVKFTAYATSNFDVEDGLLTVWMSATKGAEKGDIQAYKLAATEKAEKGDKVEVIGTLAKFMKAGADDPTLEVVQGSVKVVKETAIENTIVSQKAMKVMENGQLFIIRNGVKYNAAGAVVE